MADLVTAIAIGYDIAHFAVFVGSLRAHYSGDVTLFGSANTSSRIVSFCARQRVELRTDSVRLGLNTSSKMRLMHSRFLLYAQACTRPKYGLCLASDFRDIFFQAHPFASLRRRFGGAASLPDLLAPMEMDSLPAPEDGGDGKATPGTIAASPINRNWLRTCYGDGAASLIGNRSILNVRSARGPRVARPRPRGRHEGRRRTNCMPVVHACSSKPVASSPFPLPLSLSQDGAVIGTPEGLAVLAERFDDAVRRDLASRARHFQHWVVCGDQAVFNFAVHSGSLRHRDTGAHLSVLLEPRGSGVVNTLYRFRHAPHELSARLSADGLVLNEDRVTPSPVVHMFDRMQLPLQRKMRELRRWQQKEPL